MDPELAAKFARLRGETVEDAKPAASNKGSKKAAPAASSSKKADPPKPKKTKTKKKKQGGGGFFSGLFGKKTKSEEVPQQTSDGSRVNPGIDAEFAAKLSQRRGDEAQVRRSRVPPLLLHYKTLLGSNRRMTIVFY